MSRALFVDYAGVLTPGVADSWQAFEAAHGMPARTIATMLWAAYEADGLVERLFADLYPAGGVWALVHDVRQAGVPAVLVSNSWGMRGYPLGLLDNAFDALVFSGEVGMRKPDREIFEHAASLVDAELAASVFIDDAPANVAAAEAYGLTAVLHRGDDAATRQAVLAGLGL